MGRNECWGKSKDELNRICGTNVPKFQALTKILFNLRYQAFGGPNKIILVTWATYGDSSPQEDPCLVVDMSAFGGRSGNMGWFFIFGKRMSWNGIGTG